MGAIETMHEVIRLRGAWSLGTYYDAEDIATRGSRSYRARGHHLAGRDSEPGHGDRWADHWVVYTGTLMLRRTDPLPAQIVTHSPAVADRMAVASEIQDDSNEGFMSVAVSLDALRQALMQIERRLGQVERRAVTGQSATSPLDVEIAKLLHCSPALARAEQLRNLRRQVRLLRKRDMGLPWTKDEAADWAMLEQLDREVDRIEGNAP